MATTAYKEALSKEIEQLKIENAELTKQVRPQTLDAMGAKPPEDILRRTTRLFFAKRILIAAAVILAVMAAVLIVGSFINEVSVPFAEDNSLNDPTFIPDTTEGLNKVGSYSAHPDFAHQNGVLYYSENGTVYKTVQGETSTLVNAEATHLNAYKYCIYFYDNSDGTVYRLRTDGKEQTPIVKESGVKDLKVYNNTVYLLADDGDIHSVYINGKEGYPVIEDRSIVSFTLSEGYIYYICSEGESLSLYRMKTSRGAETKISDTDSPLLSATSGYVFYIYNGTLFGLDLSEEKAHAFFSGEAEDFIIIDNCILIQAKGQAYLYDLKTNTVEALSLERSIREASVTELTEACRKGTSR